jgi:hypothetical protein
MTKTIAEMTAEIREVNIEKGWRPAEGGPGENTWGDYIALLHSEISEMLEAYRDHRLADATGLGEFVLTDGIETERRPAKPEGVGSEMADYLIRLLDMCDVFGILPSGYERLSDIHPHEPRGNMKSFGDDIAFLHQLVSDAWDVLDMIQLVLRGLVWVARKYEIDLDAEYERKIAYNRTRAFQHGGRTLAGEKVAASAPLDELLKAMPDDVGDWWTGDEVDEFLSAWSRVGMPEATLQDATGGALTIWTDLHAAARILGLEIKDAGYGPYIEFAAREYTVGIVPTEERRRRDA